MAKLQIKSDNNTPSCVFFPETHVFSLPDYWLCQIMFVPSLYMATVDQSISVTDYKSGYIVYDRFFGMWIRHMLN